MDYFPSLTVTRNLDTFVSCPYLGRNSDSDNNNVIGNNNIWESAGRGQTRNDQHIEQLEQNNLISEYEDGIKFLNFDNASSSDSESSIDDDEESFLNSRMEEMQSTSEGNEEVDMDFTEDTGEK